jgi:hypothetical protein
VLPVVRPIVGAAAAPAVIVGTMARVPGAVLRLAMVGGVVARPAVIVTGIVARRVVGTVAGHGGGHAGAQAECHNG